MLTIAQTNIVELGTLPAALHETSGLAYYNNQLLSINDSGNDSEIFMLNPETLAVTTTINIVAENRDWEALTIDEQFVYVGDFGNNLGTRSDLKVLKFSLADLQVNTPIAADSIAFSYPEQVNFDGVERSDFDAEALIATSDYLYVFTKQWKSMNTAIYRLPKSPGTYQASFIQELSIDGLITDATYDRETNTIILLGYTSILTPFIFKADLDKDGKFNLLQEKLTLPIGIAQTEGITKGANGNFYLSCEAYENPPFVNSASRVFSFSLDEQATEEEEPGDEAPEDTNEDQPKEDGMAPQEQVMFKQPILFQPKGNLALAFKMPEETLLKQLSIFDTSGRQVAHYLKQDLQEFSINTSFLRPSIYYAQFYAENDKWVIPFLIR